MSIKTPAKAISYHQFYRGGDSSEYRKTITYHASPLPTRLRHCSNDRLPASDLTRTTSSPLIFHVERAGVIDDRSYETIAPYSQPKEGLPVVSRADPEGFGSGNTTL